MNDNPPHTRDAMLGVIFALLAAVGFSGKAILVKLAYLDHVDAITLLALRMVFAVPFFIAVAVWLQKHHAAPLNRHDKLLILALGLIGYYLSSLLDFLGLQYISAGLERLILFLYPTMTVILAAFIYKRPIDRKVFMAMALSYAGIALVFLHDVGIKQGGSVVLGATLVFASTLSYSTYLVGVGHAVQRIGTTRFTAYAMMVASAASLLQFFVMRPMTRAGSALARVRVVHRDVDLFYRVACFPAVLRDTSHRLRHYLADRLDRPDQHHLYGLSLSR